MTSFFKQIPQAPADAVFGLAQEFMADSRPEKIDLVLGIYKDERLICELLPSVQKAKAEILKEDGANYLSIDGLGIFSEEIGTLLFGEDLWKGLRERTAYAQAVGGTGALCVLAHLAAQEVTKRVFIPNRTWVNHHGIFDRAGFSVEEYPYYANHSFDFKNVCSFLEKVPEKSLILLHAVCHNPTGCDPTPKEWKEIARLVCKRNLLPIFDCAYHGFGDGLKKDREWMHSFIKEGIEFLVAYSCSKNFSLYCQRVGALFAICQSSIEKKRVGSQISRIIRVLYSNPPAHGARIVAHILGGVLRKQWEKEVVMMQERLQRTRNILVKRLGGGFDYLLRQKGMFSLLDLKEEQVKRLKEKHAIYMAVSGRISIAGLNEENIDQVVQGILSL